NYRYWQSAFGGSLSVVGKTVDLNGVPTTIVGVAESRFVSLTPGNVPDAWLPLSLNPPVGAARSIVIDEANMILAGHQTTTAAGNVGIERVRVVEADGQELIAVRRRGLTDQQKAYL